MKTVLIAVLVLSTAACGGATGYKPTPVQPAATPTHSITHKPKATKKPKAALPPFKNCQEVFEAGSVPIYPSNPRWNPKLDYDHDGMACEH